MIVCKHLSKSYANRRRSGNHVVLDDVSFQTGSQDFTCLLGPSGCGKTTLLNLIAGFIEPTGGSVYFGGRPVTGPGPDRGVVFQDPTLFPWLTVEANIAFGLIDKGASADRHRGRIEEMLRRVGLEAHARAYPHELSGGMRQRVALARILVLRPDALLMDEPFSALDAISRERLQDELLAIWKERSLPVTFVTHNANEAAYLADRVIILGPPPRNLRRIIPIPLPRPRSRNSEQLRRIASELRKQLGALPCCVPDQRRLL